MPAATRLGDADNAGNVTVTASSNVLINNKGAARVGDIDSKVVPGPDTRTTGSPTVFVNNKPIVRVDDPDSAGNKMVVGSPNVIVN